MLLVLANVVFLGSESLLTSHRRTEISVLLLRQEYRAVNRSRDYQPVLLECDVMRLRGSVFTEP
jgi:hypothetical protein